MRGGRVLAPSHLWASEDHGTGEGLMSLGLPASWLAGFSYRGWLYRRRCRMGLEIGWFLPCLHGQRLSDLRPLRRASRRLSCTSVLVSAND